MAKIVRYCVLEEEHYGDNVFLCHRPHIFGNPYIYDKKSRFDGCVKVSSLEECIRLYDSYFDKSIELNPVFREEWEKLIKTYNENNVIYLGCYCHLNKPCHTDIIKKKLEQYAVKNVVQDILQNKKDPRK